MSAMSIIGGPKNEEVNFPRAEPKPLEIETYLLNRNFAVRSPEIPTLTVTREV